MNPERGKRRHEWKAVAALCALGAFVLLKADEVPIRKGLGLAAPASTTRQTEVARSDQAPSASLDRPVAKSPGVGPTELMGDAPYSFEVAAGEVLVRFREGVSTERIRVLTGELGSRILDVGHRSGLFRLEVPVQETVASFSALMSKLPEVGEAVPNAIAVGTGCPTGGQYQSQEWQLERLNQVAACANYAPGLSQVVIAVLDTGVAFEDYTDQFYTYKRAPDLNAVTFVPGYDFVNDDTHPNDDHQHGTHIAGMIAAQGKVAGVAPGVKIMPVKVLASDKRGTAEQVIEGIYYAVDHGANIINMSLSFGLGYYPSSSLQDAISYAADHGVVMVASAGNDNAWGVTFPAAFPDVIAVGASRIKNASTTNSMDTRASYSNVGAALDVIAPSGMLSFDMNKDGYPDGILAQTFNINAPSQLSYWFYVGTSQAAANASGAAAWLLADGAPSSQIRSLMTASASHPNITQFSPEIGSGLVQLQAARDLFASGTLTPDPKYYINMLPWLENNSDGTVKAVVKMKVIDGIGHPAAGVTVAGSWYGSATSFTASAVTDTNGDARVELNNISSTTGIAVGFQADMVGAPGSMRVARPTQFYSLSPASAELYARLMQEPAVGNSVVLIKLDPSDTALDGILDRSRLQTSYVMKPVGPGLRAGPLVVVFNGAFAPEVSAPAITAVTPLTWSFPAPLYSGRGMVSSMSGTLVSAVSASLGAASSYLLLPLDPAMVGLDPAHNYPVLNSVASSFLSSNEAFGNGFASSSLGDGFASSSLGDGFASSSLGSGFASSSLGNGFASSSLGSGFASSSLGSGFASSSLGSGFASSSLGNGFASSSLGSGFASSSLGTGFASNVMGGKYTVQEAHGASLEDIGAPNIEVTQVDPSTLITEEPPPPVP